MKVIVTGATGFIGTEIVSELSKSNYELIKIGNRNNFAEDFAEENFFKVNIADTKDVKSLLKISKVDVIIHSAGLAHQFGKTKREDFFSVNVKGTENICKLAVELKAKHFILISSVAVYGKTENIKQGIDESFDCHPVGFYAESKYESEKIARKICQVNNIPLTILRPATVIGEGDAGNVARLIGAIDKNRFFWIGRGENLKSMIYKKDVARACLTVLDKKTNNTETFNISAGAVKMNQTVTIIAENLDKKVPGIFIPERILKFSLKTGYKISKLEKLQNLLETVEKWTKQDVFLSDKITRVYNFTPETSVSEALVREVDWFKRNYK